MKDPDNEKDDTSMIDFLRCHHNKTDAHNDRDHTHHTKFDRPAHTIALYIAFQIIFIKLGIDKPIM